MANTVVSALPEHLSTRDPGAGAGGAGVAQAPAPEVAGAALGCGALQPMLPTLPAPALVLGVAVLLGAAAVLPGWAASSSRS
jgi:hypothetical protein